MHAYLVPQIDYPKPKWNVHVYYSSESYMAPGGVDLLILLNHAMVILLKTFNVNLMNDKLLQAYMRAFYADYCFSCNSIDASKH